MRQLQKEIIDHAIRCVKDYIGTPVDDLHHNLFNTDYWVIGRYEAEQEITKYGNAWDAIGKIQEYEESNFGEINTDLTEPEKVCNMLVYILGEEILQQCPATSKFWDDDITDNIADEIIKELRGLL